MAGIYIHLPFCVQKCRYCDFLSGAVTPALEAEYVRALIQEMHTRLTGHWAFADTIYIGGGTPSVLSEASWTEILAALNQLVDVSSLKEWTVEANPGTVNAAFFNKLYAAGVNRLSFGVQSFLEEDLRLLGRIHSPEDALQAVQMARDAGFTNINIDLIYGLPGMTLARWQENIEAALAQNLPHLSLYGLILEEGTPLAADVTAGRLPLPDDDTAADCYLWHTARLAEAGLHPYEISNYAEPGFASAHNVTYWQMNPWLGLGLGATGFDGRTLRQNSSHMPTYLAYAGKEGVEETSLTAEELAAEVMTMGLRTTAGVDAAAFEKRFGYWPQERYDAAIRRSKAEGLLIESANWLYLTERGRLLGNEVFARFL